MRPIFLTLVIAAVIFTAPRLAPAGELTQGCMVRPACGKMCKLVCDTTKLQAVGYGCKTSQICVPSISRQGCKHCVTTCCPGDDIKGCPPKFEFCWYDWFACGCARPRTINTLTKFQSERKINSYHWEVVDANCCECGTPNGKTAADDTIYKPAPDDAEVGDVLVVSDEEWNELAPMLAPSEPAPQPMIADQPTDAASPSADPTPPKKISVAERIQGLLR